jgi:hypothetical protein
MNNHHCTPRVVSSGTAANLVESNSPTGAYPMPDPYEVARLLGNKRERLSPGLQQGLMTDILENAPQKPARVPKSQTTAS